MNQDAHAPQTQTTSGLAIAALVFCFIFAPVALILGIIALVMISKSNGRLKGSGMAIVGIVWGGLTLFVLPAVAIPAFINYMKRAKTSEATMNIDRCYEGAVAYYSQEKKLPESSQWTPAQPASDKMIAAESAPWQVSPWKDLDFYMTDNHYYQYRFVKDGQRFACEARGDLDGDGTMSLFSREGVIEDEEIHGSASLYKENPLE